MIELTLINVRYAIKNSTLFVVTNFANCIANDFSMKILPINGDNIKYRIEALGFSDSH